MKFPLGLVIGKFYPPHAGHNFLIETALAQSELVVVIVCGKPTDSIAGKLRGKWLQEIHPRADVRVIDDRYDENDSQVWAENTLEWLGRAPDAVFTSEEYGNRYAALMGAIHICVDKPRQRRPISGTEIRKDPFINWEFIDPPVRGWFAKRVCVLGAESTGTTTLARELARHFQTEWVAEYGREYSEMKFKANDSVWNAQEFVTIAAEQNRREDVAAQLANRVLICDTNSFATTLWHKRYVGHFSPDVEKSATQGHCDLYLLTGDEIPFVQDGLRDGELIRHEMHRWFETALSEQSIPWLLLRGSLDNRLKSASAAICALFDNSNWNPKNSEAKRALEAMMEITRTGEA